MQKLPCGCGIGSKGRGANKSFQWSPCFLHFNAPALLKTLKEIEWRANSNAQEVDENSNEHSGFIRIRDDARESILKAEKGE